MKDSIREITQIPELTMGLDLGDKLEVLECQLSHGKLSSLCLSKAHWNQRHLTAQLNKHKRIPWHLQRCVLTGLYPVTFGDSGARARCRTDA